MNSKGAVAEAATAKAAAAEGRVLALLLGFQHMHAQFSNHHLQKIRIYHSSSSSSSSPSLCSLLTSCSSSSSPPPPSIHLPIYPSDSCNGHHDRCRRHRHRRDDDYYYDNDDELLLRLLRLRAIAATTLRVRVQLRRWRQRRRF